MARLTKLFTLLILFATQQLFANTTLLKTFTTSASGGNIVKISTHGNIFHFESPTSFQHIGLSHNVTDGYVLCNSGTNRWDIGPSESGFGAPTTACPTATTCNVTRSTTDGLLRLRQDFVFIPTGRQVEVKITITNISAGSLSNVIFRRHVHFHLDNDFLNNFGASQNDACFAWGDAADSPAVDHMMTLRHYNGSVGHVAKGTSPPSNSSCSPVDSLDTDPVLNGHLACTLEYAVGSLTPGQAKTFTVRYQRD